jgi:hypothetical protein
MTTSPLLVASVVALAACHDAPKAPASLADDLGTATAADVSSWRFTQAEWDALVVEPYKGPAIYADYGRAFDTQVGELAAQLAAPGPVATRAHYAGDPRLTLGQSEARWALPVQFASQVATKGGRAIDAVFVRVGDHWRALTGIDRLVRDRVAAIDPACAQLLAKAGPTGRCTDVAWVIADAGLRGDRPRFAHACQLATNLCAVVHGSP